MRALNMSTGIGVLLFAGIAGAAAVGAVSLAAGPSTAMQASDEARRITPEELRTPLQKHEAILIDVRSEESYKSGHIRGARWIPAGEILSHVNELPHDKMIVTYCS